MRAPVATGIAIGVGLVVLLGYFVPLGLLQDVRTFLLGWAVILAAVAGLVGILNLIMVHWRKATATRERDFYSIFLILAFLITSIAGLVLTPSHQQFQQVVNSIQVPVEISLMAVLSITLAYACLRLLQRRKGWMAWLFIISVMVFLVLNSGFFSFLQGVPILGDLVGSLERLPLAGARGILLGVALGSLTAGIRILLGADRPFSG